MNNRTNKYAFLVLLAAGLGSCASEDFWDTFDRTVDGPIDFTVGIESSPAQRAMTRGEGDPTYYAMKTGSQVRLKVDGKWKGKPSEDISQQATCKTETLTSTANSLTYDAGQTLYWDDYGAGDPANKEYNDKGLSVLGVAVDGETEAPAPENGKWDALAWSTVDNDGKAEVNSSTHLLKKDIIVSNNLSAFKFAERKTTGEMNFKHPLCKITFNIKAGAGFPNTGVGATDIKFAKDPILTLSKATTLAGVSESSNNYALTTGTINIKEGTATANTTPAKVIAATTSTSDKDITVIKQALVYPDTPLGASDDAVIAVLQADDNVYYIKAKEIHDKMTGHTDFKTKAGYNYIINIIVNKSGIQLTATVTDWNKVNSDEVHPIINVNATVGDGGTNPTKENTFAFYRSENIEKDYEKAASPKVKTDGTMDWTGTTILYWSSHYQHYHFRGIYPETTGVEKDADDKHQYVKVTNGEYNANTFPSNFVIGMPEIASGTLCGNKDHTQVDMSIYGICAREAFINMNFRYMMSQVEVVLSSSESTSKNYVDVTNAVVELVNVYNSGNILLKDRTAEVTGTAEKFTLPISDAGEHKYLGVIVPQELTYSTAGASTNVRIKITVTNTDNTKDIYYADVNPIYKKGTTDLIAPNGKWESGVHYVYNLKVTKTEIMATASLTDWSKVEAEENVWF